MFPNIRDRSRSRAAQLQHWVTSDVQIRRNSNQSPSNDSTNSKCFRQDFTQLKFFFLICPLLHWISYRIFTFLSLFQHLFFIRDSIRLRKRSTENNYTHLDIKYFIRLTWKKNQVLTHRSRIHQVHESRKSLWNQCHQLRHFFELLLTIVSFDSCQIDVFQENRQRIFFLISR